MSYSDRPYSSGYGQGQGRPTYRDRGYDDTRNYIPPAPPAPSGPPAEPHIVFKGKYYSLARLKGLVGIGHHTVMAMDLVHPKQDTIVDFAAAEAAHEHTSILVTPYEGKMVVLLGMAKLKTDLTAKAAVKAMCLSSVALKKAALYDVPSQPAQ